MGIRHSGTITFLSIIFHAVVRGKKSTDNMLLDRNNKAKYASIYVIFLVKMYTKYICSKDVFVSISSLKLIVELKHRSK